MAISTCVPGRGPCACVCWGCAAEHITCSEESKRVYGSAGEREAGDKNASPFHSQLIVHFPYRAVSSYSVPSLLTSALSSHRPPALPAALSSGRSDTILPRVQSGPGRLLLPACCSGLLSNHRLKLGKELPSLLPRASPGGKAGACRGHQPVGCGEPSAGCQEWVLKPRHAPRQGLEEFTELCQG